MTIVAFLINLFKNLSMTTCKRAYVVKNRYQNATYINLTTTSALTKSPGSVVQVLHRYILEEVTETTPIVGNFGM